MVKSVVSPILFSCLSGHNIYIQSKYNSACMVHLDSNTEVTIRHINNMDASAAKSKWRFFIENPIDIKNIIWPFDIVELPNGDAGLVFRARAFPKLVPIKTLMYNSSLLGWTKPDIKEIVTNLLYTFDNLHKGGYTYHIFDMDKIFYNAQSKDVLFDFSAGISISPKSEFADSYIDKQCVALEFLPPWKDFSSRDSLSLFDDYYSISALLFRLLIGRMPYQGRLMDGHGDLMDHMRDIDEDDHIRMIEHYHSHPVFIFDRNDKSNSIGLYTHEERIVELWADLPEKIKDMFADVFSSENLNLPNSAKRMYKPHEWLSELKANNVI